MRRARSVKQHVPVAVATAGAGTADACSVNPFITFQL